MKPRYTDNRYQHGYRKACETDIRKTFARIRREQQANAKEVSEKVEPLNQHKRKTA